MIIKNITDESFGARPLRRLIQNLVEDKIAYEYLEGKIKENFNITAYAENDEVKFK